MRVAMISEHASPLAALGGVDAGGQNVHVACLATALARRGAEVTVFTRRDAGSLPRRMNLERGLTVEHVDAGPPRPVPKDELWPYMTRFAAQLSRSLAARPPDVVHAHFWMSGAAAVWAAGPLGVPVVQTFHALGVVKRRHQGVEDTSPAERIGVEQALLDRVDHVIATCTDEVFELARMGAEQHRVSVVPCGVDLSRFRPDVAAEPRDRRPRLVVLSRMVPRKGIGNAIEAMAKLPEAELVVAGGPPREQLAADAEGVRLMSLARSLGVSRRVDLRGAVERDQVPSLLRSADAVLCVPWYEPFGIVPLEAMACGVPVVASAVGGLTDTVVHDCTGVHVPPRRPDLVAKAATRLLADDGLRERLGASGTRRARERYGWDVVAEGSLRVYAGVIERGQTAVGDERRYAL